MNATDQQILKAADQPPVRRRAVAAELGLSSPAFHQRLLHLLNDPEAVAMFPAVVNRQKRLRERRQRGRIST